MTRTSSIGLAALAAIGAPLVSGVLASDFQLGVQTHFSQGWPETLLDQVEAIRARGLRDSVPWSAGERRKGEYDFSSLKFDAIREACQAGQDFVLTLMPVNGVYDGGAFVHTAEGRAAFAAYVNAVLDTFGNCVAAIEVGNEINTANAIKGPAARDKIASYTALIRVVYAKVKPSHRNAAILGGSTNVVGTGFLEELFQAGMLDVCDGVVVHPYRRTPEGLEVELGRLNDAMSRAGNPKPIWATEFSDDFKSPDDAAPFLLKMTAILSAAGVERAYWYALIDQKWYPKMGLFSAQIREKPAAAAFVAAQDLLLKSGHAARVDVGTSLLRVYRFGDGNYLVWGAPRSIAITSGRAWNVTGQEIPLPQKVSDTPFILSADAAWTLGAPQILADTRYQYGEAPFSYTAERPDGPKIPLEMIDWEWTSYWGTKWTAPLRVNLDTLAVAGNGKRPVRAVIRYSPEGRGPYRVAVCADKADKGDGMDVEVRAGGKTLSGGLLKTRWSASPLVDGGHDAEIAFGPHQVNGGDAANYRIRILPPTAPVPAC